MYVEKMDKEVIEYCEHLDTIHKSMVRIHDDLLCMMQVTNLMPDTGLNYEYYEILEKLYNSCKSAMADMIKVDKPWQYGLYKLER